MSGNHTRDGGAVFVKNCWAEDLVVLCERWVHRGIQGRRQYGKQQRHGGGHPGHYGGDHRSGGRNSAPGLGIGWRRHPRQCCRPGGQQTRRAAVGPLSSPGPPGIHRWPGCDLWWGCGDQPPPLGSVGRRRHRGGFRFLPGRDRCGDLHHPRRAGVPRSQ